VEWDGKGTKGPHLNLAWAPEGLIRPCSYLLVGSRYISTAQAEFNNILCWAARNNLKLNSFKTKELIINERRSPRASSPALPVMQGAERVSSMTILGVVFNSKQTMVDHLDHLLTTCASSIHALRMLRTHGLHQQQLNVAASATTMALCFAGLVGLHLSTRQGPD